MLEERLDPSVEVSQWLREVGARRWRHAQPAAAPEPPVIEQRPRREPALLRRALLLGLLLVASLQYVYTSTTVEILSLPSLLVFVFAG